MADALIGLTEITATANELVENFVQEALIEKMILAPNVQQSIAPKGAKTVKISRSDLPTVGTKVENSQADAQVLTYAADSLLLDQHKYVQYLIEDIASIQSNVMLLEDVMLKAAGQLASDLDLYVYTKLVAASASAPDHRVAYQTGSTMTAADIINARKLLRAQNVDVSNLFLAINPEQEAELLAISQFIQADSYGSAGGLVNGELGKLYGVRVLVSNNVTADASVMFHPSAVALGRQILPKVEFQRDLAYLSDRLSISHLFGAITLDSGKRCVKIGSAS